MSGIHWSWNHEEHEVVSGGPSPSNTLIVCCHVTVSVSRVLMPVWKVEMEKKLRVLSRSQQEQKALKLRLPPAPRLCAKPLAADVGTALWGRGLSRDGCAQRLTMLDHQTQLAFCYYKENLNVVCELKE